LFFNAQGCHGDGFVQAFAGATMVYNQPINGIAIPCNGDFLINFSAFPGVTSIVLQASTTANWNHVIRSIAFDVPATTE
jgi:hypothetical protein